MYLKRLEMVGFKSFAERTRLEFEPGITAVVGPNGCGKSNVVDAIRWCLGEMSAKSLRSKMLVDVIFNGSANRAPGNLSEVSLTFDNSQNRLPIDYSEITVTRRLFRSGESEYFLNKTQCRLKDIKELFLDTGIGEEGYSIMEQGRVEYILSARPEERRELFEEAAGVSKYKARREEALRKMERTQLDLDRLADVIAMTKEQMDKIESAVRKARQYQKLQEDLKTMEITHWLWDYGQLAEQLASMQQALQVIEADLQLRTTQINQGDAQLTELRWQETQLGEKLVALNKQLSDVEGAINLAEQKRATALERQEEIRHRDVVLDTELEQGQSRLSELKEIRAQLKKDLDAEAGTAQESAALLQKAEETHAAQAALLKELEARAKELQESLWRSSQERAQNHNDVASQRSLEARLDTEISSLQKDRAKSDEKRLALDAALEAAGRDLASREELLAQLDEAALKSRRDLEAQENALAEMSRMASEMESKFYQSQAQLEAQDKWEASDVYSQGVQALLGRGFPGLQGPLGKLVEVSAGDEKVVRQVLGGHLNDLVADSLDEAQAALQWLAAEGKGRARILVLDRLPQAERPASPGTGQWAVIDRVKADAKFEPVLRSLLSRWIVSGSTLFGEGILEGGSDLPAAPVFDALSREKLQKEIAHVAAARESLEGQRAEGEKRRQSLREAWESARQAHESARLQGQMLRDDWEKEKVQAGLLQNEMQLIDGDLERLTQERRAAEETAQGIEKRLEELKADEERARAEWQGLQDSLQGQQAAAGDAATELAVARERASSYQERIEWKEKQISDLEAEMETIKASLEAKKEERAGSRQKVEEQERIQEESASVVEGLLTQRQEASRGLESIHTERQTLYERVNEVQNDLTELRNRAEELKAQLQDKKLQQSHAEFRRESILTQLKEKYALTPEEAGQTYTSTAQPANPADLEKLRRRVESLGAVNLAAPEEHAQLEERYNFLLSQQQDLVKAKEDLHQTINKINAATRQNFRETFDKVRENFKAIYGQLFQGGEADIRFTDEADLLNTGIEIFAQPPGKKLTNISALSGGEKALTAVSLLFAFFMVRPAPFCVLDEVDAPLDEANVTRFITLIKAFTHQSQFLMITHNKRSMETADTLYGVTMETLGVSRILSARLKKDGSAGTETERPESVIKSNR